MDLAIRYRFGDGTATILVLVEHWSDAGKLDLLRTARYFLDLMKRFPGETILPIALVDDDRPRELQDWVVEGRLELEEQREVKRKLEEMAMPEIMEWFKQDGIEEGIERGMERGIEQGLEQGLRLKALEDARKMVEHGITWSIITDVTGIKPEDLTAN